MAYFREQNDDDFRARCAEDDDRRDAAEYRAELMRDGEDFELPEDADEN